MTAEGQISFWIVTLVFAGAGAWFGAYLREKGKNYATKEDVQALTRLTEEVKTQVASKSWVEQRRWDLKKDLYIQLIDILGKLRFSLSDIERTYARGLRPEPELTKEWRSGMDRFFHLWGVSHLFVSNEILRAFTTFIQVADQIQTGLRNEGVAEEDQSFEQSASTTRVVKERIDQLLTAILENAKHDLLLASEQQSSAGDL